LFFSVVGDFFVVFVTFLGGETNIKKGLRGGCGFFFFFFFFFC